MSSFSLPCPVCSAPLIVDGENAGHEVLCPGCESHLQLPSTVSATARPEIVGTGRGADVSEPNGIEENPAKASLPQSRSKSVEEERKRLAAAAAAAGGANSFRANEAGLPTDHRPAVLPSKRPKPVAAAESTTTAESPSGENAGPRSPVVLPTKRSAKAPLDPRESAVVLKPMEPREDIEMGGTALTGPSRFVRPDMPAAESPVTPPAPAVDPPENEGGTEAASGDHGPIPRGGYRLGGSRQLHFSPAPAADGDAEAATWGAQAETAEQAARGRRFISLAIIIALLAAGGVAIYMVREAFAKKEQIAGLTDEEPVVAAKSTEDVMRNVEDARRVLKRFLEADTIGKLAAEVRHPEVSQPRMERYYALNPLKPRKIKTESQSWSEIRIGDTEFIRGAMELDDFRVRNATLEIIPGRDPKVDWESYVNWAEMPWKDFLRTPPEQSMEYRVTVSLDPRDQYYNYSFKGREFDLLCFKLEDPEKYGSCWAYCDKDSDAASQLLFNLKRSRQQGIVNDEGKIAISCILKLRFPPEGMKTNQVMIEKFVHDNWVQP